MRIANLSGRLVLIIGGRAVDVGNASEGRFESDPQAIYARWAEFRSWAAQADLPAGAEFDAADLGAPAPAPRQLLAAGLNYRDHAGESGFAVPEGLPPVFTKFASSITGPVTTVRLPPGGHTDWEIELVVVIGTRAWQVAESDAWRHVAGLTVGQDLSERISQLAGPAPQFSLGKSLPGFTPMGPYLVTPDEFADPDDLGLRATLNGEQVQKARTSELIFPVPALISRLSARLPLLPGDVIFTGTPAGVGLGRDPQRWLADGDELVSAIEGIGELRQRFAERKEDTVALHQLTSFTLGVPNLEETAAYYREFGLADEGDGWFATRDGGRQLRLVPAPARRLIELRIGVDDADDLGPVQRPGCTAWASIRPPTRPPGR